MKYRIIGVFTKKTKPKKSHLSRILQKYSYALMIIIRLHFSFILISRSGNRFSQLSWALSIHWGTEDTLRRKSIDHRCLRCSMPKMRASKGWVSIRIVIFKQPPPPPPQSVYERRPERSRRALPRNRPRQAGAKWGQERRTRRRTRVARLLRGPPAPRQPSCC